MLLLNGAIMKFEKLEIEGAYLIKLEPFEDERGNFARAFCAEEFEKAGIDFKICQCNRSYNRKKGTIRGMHWQKEPYGEGKIVSCTKGAIFDVIADVRKDSKTYLKWYGVELTEDNNTMLYIPPYVAHGYQTLADDTYVFYQVSEFYKPDCYGVARYDDPALGIKWKDIKPVIINDRDKSYPLLEV